MKVTKISERFFALGFAVIVLMFAGCALAEPVRNFVFEA